MYKFSADLKASVAMFGVSRQWRESPCVKHIKARIVALRSKADLSLRKEKPALRQMLVLRRYTLDGTTALTHRGPSEELRAHKSWTIFASFWPDGRYVVTASDDDAARIRGRAIRTLTVMASLRQGINDTAYAQPFCRS